MQKANTFAVLTGDVIGSTASTPEEMDSIRKSLSDSAEELRRWRRGLVQSRLEFFRGDSWQLLLSDPSLALRAAVFLRAALRSRQSVDSRIAIGIGSVEKVSRRRVSLSSGRAFEISGRALDKLAPHGSLTIEIQGAFGVLGPWLPVIGTLCDALIAGWTRRQAEIVRLATHPDGPVHEVIGNSLIPPVTQQTVTRALKAAHWRSLREAILQFERTDWATSPRLP